MPEWYQAGLPFQLVLSARLAWLWIEGRLHGEEFILIVLAQAVLGIVAAALWIWGLDRGTPRTGKARITERLTRAVMVLLSVPAAIFLIRWAVDVVGT